MKTTGKYILNTHGEPVACEHLEEWAAWFKVSNNQRIVKQEKIGEVKVSTVFLSVDHAWMKGPPVLWETMCFGGVFDQDMTRCSGRREQAEAMHQEMVRKVKEGK